MSDVLLNSNQTFATPQAALAHHGVKGQKWGVRNEKKSGAVGPSREEKKQEKRDEKVAELRTRAAKADIRVGEIKKELDAVPPGIKTYIQRNELKNELVSTTGYRDHLNKTAESVQAGKLSPRQKQLIVAGAIGGGLVLAAYGASKMQSGEFNAMKLRGQAALQRKPFDFKKNDEFGGKKSADDVLSHVVPGINPNYKEPGGQMNCRRCSLTYELRRRGYDVEATPSSLGYGQSESGLLNALTPGLRNLSRAQSMSMGVTSGRGIRALARGDRRKNTAETYSHSDAKDRTGFLSLLNKQPDGARGEAVFNFGEFGHSLSYERFGDKTYIFDTQKGQRYDVGDEASYGSFLNKWGVHRVSDIQVTRLDNVSLDHQFLARWSTNRRGSSAPSRPATTSTRPDQMSRDNWRALLAKAKA